MSYGLVSDCHGLMEYISPTDELNPYSNCKPEQMISKVTVSTAASNCDIDSDHNEECLNSIHILKEYPQEYHLEIPANLDKKMYD